MIDEVESKRITEITDEPTVTDDDYVVIDGLKGTRKIPISGLLVKFGYDDPEPDFGTRGMIFIKLSGASIDSMYYKLTDNTWVQILNSEYSPAITSLSEMTWEEVAQYTWSELTNFTW